MKPSVVLLDSYIMFVYRAVAPLARTAPRCSNVWARLFTLQSPVQMAPDSTETDST